MEEALGRRMCLGKELSPAPLLQWQAGVAGEGGEEGRTRGGRRRMGEKSRVVVSSGSRCQVRRRRYHFFFVLPAASTCGGAWSHGACAYDSAMTGAVPPHPPQYPVPPSVV